MGNNWELSHVGLIVRDLDKAIEYFRSLGIGTFEPEEIKLDSSTVPDFKVHGKPEHHKGRVRVIHIGSLVLELIQPIEGNTPHQQFLDKYGEGVNHIGFKVDNLDNEADKLVEKGVEVNCNGKTFDGAGFVYFDTREVGNLYMELITMP